jgi:hypothetical protein
MPAAAIAYILTILNALMLLLPYIIGSYDAAIQSDLISDECLML